MHSVCRRDLPLHCLHEVVVYADSGRVGYLLYRLFDQFFAYGLPQSSLAVVGYGIGGSVALHAVVLDKRIARIASFSGFTPMRTDTNNKPTGGNQRWYSWHSTLPRLGLFVGDEKNVPYDYDELLREVAPRPTLLYTPLYDRDSDYDDVSKCIESAAGAWKPGMLAHLSPNTHSDFHGQELWQLLFWLGNSTNTM